MKEKQQNNIMIFKTNRLNMINLIDEYRIYKLRIFREKKSNFWNNKDVECRLKRLN